MRYLFWLACLSILEDVSYTRKDGQYLRWDHRSSRQSKSAFDKGTIYEFKSAILNKLRLMLDDLRLDNGPALAGRVQIIEGSCLS